MSARHTSLDAVRGVAVLGILAMNVVSYGLGFAPYFNLAAGGNATVVDWTIGGLGEVFVDQKFMGLFSLLFGASLLLFLERAQAKGRRAVALSLWRNLLLLGMGLGHAALWEGDVLTLYALCAPPLLLVRGWSARALALAGGACLLAIAPVVLWGQAQVDPAGAALGELWVAGADPNDPRGWTTWLTFMVDVGLRALGLMLLGMAAYKAGVVTGARSDRTYRRLMRWGLGLGLPLSAAGLAWVVWAGFDPSVALVHNLPNLFATVPVTAGYLGALVLWDRRDGPWQRRLRAVGRTALSNYIGQTVLCLFVLQTLAVQAPTRSTLAGLMVGVWALQLWLSPWWLARYRFGPLEWLWRCATYRRWLPLRR